MESVQRNQEQINLTNENLNQHFVWLNELGDSLFSGDNFTGELDYTMCEFGRWYYEFRNTRDLTQKLEVKSKADLASAFNSFIDKLRGIIGGVMDIAVNVNSGSESVSSASEEMSSSLEEVSASTNEFASNAENLSTNCQSMSEANSRILERAA